MFDVVPVTVMAEIEAGYRYRVFWKGSCFEMHTQPGSRNPQVGDLVMARVAANKSQLFLPSSRGGEVIMAGTSGGAPRFVWTSDFVAASPTWTGNVSGLPATASDVPYMAYGATNVALVTTDGSTSSLYLNQSFKTGAWSLILDLATINTLLGTAYGSVNMYDPAITPTGDIYVFVETDNVFFDYAFHSHDNGTTWTGVQVLPAGANYYNIVVGMHTGQVVYVYGSVGASWRVARSDDGGHSFAVASSGAILQAAYLGLPYEGNSAESTIFFGYGPGFGSIAIQRSIDSAVTWGAWSATGLRPWFDENDSQIAYSWWASNPSAYESSDNAVTWTTHVTPISVNHIHKKPGGAYALCGQATAYVYYSADLSTYSSRLGNLLTIFSGASPACRVVLWV